jgi:hypothetical protein
MTEYTLEERLACALCTHETVDLVPPSLEEWNQQLDEVKRTWRRFEKEAKDFLETLDKCGLTLSLKPTKESDA